MNLRDEIEGLLVSIGGHFDPPLSETLDVAAYTDKIVKNATIFSVHDQGKLAGFMAVYCNDQASKIAYGTMLAVAETHRSYGLGPNLIKSTLDFLKRNKFKAFKLEIYKSNPRVILLYKRMGFNVSSETLTSVYVDIEFDS